MKTKLTFLILSFLIFGSVNSQTFQDDLSREALGDFPTNWDLIQGYTEVTTVDGNKAIRFENRSIITPKIGSIDYLSDNFTLEFDAYFDTAPKSYRYTLYNIRFWSGTTITPVYNNLNGKGSYSVLSVFRHGVTLGARDNINGSTKHTIFKPELEDKNAVWRTININYNKGALKVLIDDVQVLQIPNYKLIPKMISIEGYAVQSGVPLLSAVKKISLSYNTTSGNNIDALVDIDSPVDLDSPIDEDIDAISTDPELPDTTIQPEIIDSKLGASGLETIDEGNGIGWRLIGRDPNNFGNIGIGAVDLSNSPLSSTNNGATGNLSFSTGINTRAEGSESTAMGSGTTASGTASTAMGWRSTASGRYSTAMGQRTAASGVASTAMGNHSTASGEYSMAIGGSTKALGEYSMATGASTYALGDASFSLGGYTTAEGNLSIATGNKTKAIGTQSASFGESTIANGTNSIAMGLETNTITPNSLVIGYYNDNFGTNNILFQIGNGTDNSFRSNAFEILNNGNGLMQGTLSNYSDKRLKTNISDLDYGLTAILKLKPVSYNWKRYPEQTKKSIGLIAQDVHPIIKELVGVGEDKDQTLSLNYTGLIPVLVKAIQEQQQIINGRDSEIKDLKAQLQSIDQRMKSLEVLNKTTQ